MINFATVSRSSKGPVMSNFLKYCKIINMRDIVETWVKPVPQAMNKK